MSNKRRAKIRAGYADGGDVTPSEPLYAPYVRQLLDPQWQAQEASKFGMGPAAIEDAAAEVGALVRRIGPRRGEPGGYEGGPADPDVHGFWQIYNKKTGRTVGKASTFSGARRSVDNNDNKYGGYIHGRRWISANPDEPPVDLGYAHGGAIRTRLRFGRTK